MAFRGRSPSPSRILAVLVLVALLGVCAFLLTSLDADTHSRDAHILDALSLLDPTSSSSGTENASLVVVCQEKDLADVLATMQHVEDAFNRAARYPWVILDAEPFSDVFIHRVRALTHTPVHFGLIPSDAWNAPEWIDPARAEHGRRLGKALHVPDGGSERVRNVHRFYSGFFFRHPLLEKYKYAWRVDPGTRYTCAIHDDPFTVLRMENRTHGFALASRDVPESGPTFWEHVDDFVTANPALVKRDADALRFVSDDGGDSYNFCRLRTSFWVTDMDFWRGDAFRAFFEHLDRAGGFYYERWSDAIVQTTALALFVDRTRVRFFDAMGLATARRGVQRCPDDGAVHAAGRCWCDPGNEDLEDRESCLPQWLSFQEGSGL